MKGGILYWVVPLITFFLGGGLVYIWQSGNLPTTAPSDAFEQEATYKFINPLLFCTDQGLSNLTSATSRDIESQVGDYIDAKKASGELIDAAVYFRDLNIGPWAIVNRQLLSAPSSLLKVPLAISIYKHGEKDPSFVSKTLKFGGGQDVDKGQHFAPPERIQPGLTYSVEDLVRYTLVDSDNAAVFLLSSLLTDEELKDSYDKLGVPPPTTDKGEYQLDVRTYASFFRILYNASYLSQDDSEHILSLLSQSTFKNGIVGGLPKDIVVSHKFGEAIFPGGKLQLHDCGIVYKPNQPYLLCVMTHGTDFDKLSKSLGDISKIVWDVLENKK